MSTRNVKTSNGRDVCRTAGCLCKFIQDRDEWTAEDFYLYARERGLTGKAVQRHLGNILKGFKSAVAGVIVKTDGFKLSERGTPLPIWTTKK